VLNEKVHVLVFINYWIEKCTVKHWNTQHSSLPTQKHNTVVCFTFWSVMFNDLSLFGDYTPASVVWLNKYGALVEWHWQGKTEFGGPTRRKPPPSATVSTTMCGTNCTFQCCPGELDSSKKKIHRPTRTLQSFHQTEVTAFRKWIGVFVDYTTDKKRNIHWLQGTLASNSLLGAHATLPSNSFLMDPRAKIKYDQCRVKGKNKGSEGTAINLRHSLHKNLTNPI
jgi:hypothetical protein